MYPVCALTTVYTLYVAVCPLVFAIEGVTADVILRMKNGEDGGRGTRDSAWVPEYKKQNKKRAPITSMGCKVQLPC